MAVAQLVADIPPEDYMSIYGTYCRTTDVLVTIYDCIETSGNISRSMGYKNVERKMKTSTQSIQYNCKQYYGVPDVLSYKELVSAWEAAPKPFANYTTANTTGVLPFSVPAQIIAPLIKGLEGYGDNYYYTDRYAEWTLYYVVICVGLATVFNFLTWALPKGAELTANNYLGRVLRRVIISPPMWNKRLARWAHFHSSRLPAFEIFGFFVMNTVMLSVNYRWDIGAIYESRSQAVGGMLGWRTGIMVMYKLPFLFLFAGRNNFLIWMTGWDYNTFNIWHRWIARIATIEVLIHWAAYSVDVAEYLAEEWQMWYWIAGVIASLIMVIMCVQGSVWLRRKAYEFFLYTHIIWATAFLVFAYFHVVWVDYPMQTLYTCFALWGYDRVARLVRMSLSGVCVATIRVCPDDVLVVDIKDKNPVRAYPGSHVFVYFMDRRFFYQSHPFTAVKTSDGLKLYLKAWNGITKKIQQMAEKNGNILEMKVLVEGPYGPPMNLKSFDELVCIAGGIGITSIYSHLSERIFSGEMNQKCTLHWVVRHEEFFSTFCDDLKKFTNAGIKIILHVTHHGMVETANSEESFDRSSSNSGKEKVHDVTDSESYDIELGRPNLLELVSGLVENATGSTCFVTCGPPGMNRDVRSAVSSSLMKTKYYVDCFEEGFEM